MCLNTVVEPKKRAEWHGVSRWASKGVKLVLEKEKI